MRAIACLAPVAMSLFGLACRESPQTTHPLDRPSAALGRLAIAPRFQPPADGQLTDAMIDRYVRTRAAAKGRSEIEAARGFGMDSDELVWVRARIIEALAALDSRKIRNASEESYSRAIASLRRARETVKDKETLKTLNEQIAALEKEKASLKTLETLPASIMANSRRVAPRRADLEIAR
jgi:hypothetical protein